MSENIRVRSVLGRFLEHSRFFIFRRGDGSRYFLGSADLLPRNLDGRIEVVTPVEARASQTELDSVAKALLDANADAWELAARWIVAPSETDARQRRPDRSDHADRPGSRTSPRPCGRVTERRMKAAAFFDLDHTLISRATPIALANSFRRRRLIRRRDLVRAAAWHLIFLVRGLEEEAVRKGACEGMILLKGIAVEELQQMLGEAMEHVLAPLVYAEPLELLERHRRQGEPAYVLSASLNEVVVHIARDLGFDGAIGSTCEIVDGVYTGKALDPCFGVHKANAMRAVAEREGIDLSRSTAYSDSHTDLAFLEAVGHPVAVNPDRKLRRVARERGWRVLRFNQHRSSRHTPSFRGFSKVARGRFIGPTANLARTTRDIRGASDDDRDKILGSVPHTAGGRCAIAAVAATVTARFAFAQDRSAPIGTGVVVIETNLGYQGGAGCRNRHRADLVRRVLTNNHVIRGATTIKIVIPGTGRSYLAKVLGYDVAHDVAVVQTASASNLKTVALGDSSSLRIGQLVKAVGNAGGTGSLTKTIGQITGLGRTITVNDDSGGTSTLRNLIETSANLQPGDSGGPLVDTTGKVIGMDSAASSSGVYQDISTTDSYAIPINRRARRSPS